MTLETQAAFARRLGVSKQCVADYIKRKKIDGAALVQDGKATKIDVEKATAQLKRRLDPDQRISGNARANLRTPAEPLPISDAAMLWDVLRQVPAIVAWEVAEASESLQRCFDASANLQMNIIGEMRLCHGVQPPEGFEEVDWPGLAEVMDLDLIDPAEMHADWDRRRLAPSDF